MRSMLDIVRTMHKLCQGHVHLSLSQMAAKVEKSLYIEY